MAAALVLVLAGCSHREPPRRPPPPAPRAVGVYHRVGPGETLGRIARAYGIDYRLIARVNHLRDPSRISSGQRLFIPGAIRTVAVPPDDGLALAPLDRAATTACPTDAPHLLWPIIDGTVTSAFGPRHGNHHDGIDIAAPGGAPIRAAGDGEVAYSGTLPGYGNMIIVRHAGGYVTVYAHNDRHHAAEGARVRGGQLIATVGRSGRATAPNLHFEVRKDNVAYDPLQFLPPLNAASGKRGPSDARSAGGAAGQGG